MLKFSFQFCAAFQSGIDVNTKDEYGKTGLIDVGSDHQHERTKALEDQEDQEDLEVQESKKN